MRVLAIETSCDETSASVVTSGENIIVNSLSTSTSVNLHELTGGIIPEQAAREQLKYIIPVIVEALWNSKNSQQNTSYEEKFKASQKILNESIDAIAVTVGPGLIGSLLVGVETAKTLAYIFEKPIIPVNHLLGHLYANFIQPSTPSFPFIGLIVSGSHTDLLLFESHEKFRWLGGTRDDAAGECFDKCARLLGYDYPGGPKVSKLAEKGNSKIFPLPKPMIDSGNFDFSFSGLKTAFLRLVSKEFPVVKSSTKGNQYGWQHIIPEDKLEERNKQKLYDICAALEQTIVDVLVKKTLKAAVEYNAKSILVGGGVAANQKLFSEFQSSIINHQSSIKLFFPKKIYCTDNAAMIGAFALFHNNPVNWKSVHANPELYFT